MSQSTKSGNSGTTRQEFMEILAQVGSKLVNRARRKCTSKDEAEDVVQTAVLWCLNNLDKARGPVKSWLYWAVDTRISNLNQYYKRRGQSVVYLEDFREEYTDSDGEDHEITNECFEALAHNPTMVLEKQISVRQALDKLTTEERHLAEAVLVEGVTVEDYAEERGLALRTAGRKLAGVKEKLKNLLSEWQVS